MLNDDLAYRTGEICLSPQQLNDIIEDKLTHLQPVLECALGEILRARDALSPGDESWREIFARARSAAA